jgi:hypothetical protein
MAIRRAGKQWREGAPDYVADCFDNPDYGDRYTVLFKGLSCDGYTAYLGLSSNPTHPQGCSMWGEGRNYEIAAYRYRNGKHRIRWLDLPENVRKHVIARVESN